MTEALKMVKSVKFIKIKGPRKPGPLEFDQKLCKVERDLTIFKICMGVALGGGGGGGGW